MVYGLQSSTHPDLHSELLDLWLGAVYCDALSRTLLID
jgi:hypothetical protein